MLNSVPSTVLAIGLPAGGKLVASASLRTQSAECSAAANLQVQIAPWIASISCQFLILRLLKPLIDIVRGLPSPTAEALQEFSKAAAELQPCLFAQTAAGVLPFIRDLLCLEIQSLNCLQHNLQSMTTLAAFEPSAVATARADSDLIARIVTVVIAAHGRSLCQRRGASLARRQAHRLP